MQCTELDPLFTVVILLVHNTPIFTKAEPTRRTRAAPTIRIGIAKHIVVVNVVIGLPDVGVKEFPHGSTVVANQSPPSDALGKTRLIAHAIISFSVLANVLGGENVKFSLQVSLQSALLRKESMIARSIA
jgi:hypothetical protein